MMASLDEKFQQEVRRLVEKQQRLARESARKLAKTVSSSAAGTSKRHQDGDTNKLGPSSSARRFPLSIQNRRSRLDTAPVVYTQVSLLPCPQCPAQFTAQKFLHDHQFSVHGAGKTHKCDQCSKWFTQEILLNEHKLQAHGDMPVDVQVTTGSQVKCSECRASFGSLNLMHAHRKIEHAVKRKLFQNEDKTPTANVQKKVEDPKLKRKREDNHKVGVTGAVALAKKVKVGHVEEERRKKLPISASISVPGTKRVSEGPKVTPAIEAAPSRRPPPSKPISNKSDLGKNQVVNRATPASPIEKEVAEILLELKQQETQGQRKEGVGNVGTLKKTGTVPILPTSSSTSTSTAKNPDQRIARIPKRNPTTKIAAVEVRRPLSSKKSEEDEWERFQNSLNDSPEMSSTFNEVAGTLLDLQRFGRRESSAGRDLNASFFLHMNRYDPDEV